MMNAFKYIDFIGSPIQFRFKTEEKYKSIFGGILSIALIFMILIFSFPLFIGMLTYSTPNVVKGSINKESAYLDLSKNFPLMMTVFQRGNIYLPNQDSYFTISAFSYNGNITYNGSQKILTLNLNPMNLHKCSNDTIYNDFGEYTNLFLSSYSNPDLSTAYCFPMGEKLAYIYGFPGQRPVNYLSFSINFCDNSTSLVQCKTMDEIKKALSNAMFYLSYPDYYLDHSKTEPGVFFLNSKVFPVSATFFKRYYLDYRPVEYTTDKGIVSEELEKKIYYQKYLEDKDFNLEVKGITNTSFAELTVTTFSKNVDSYTRSFKKLPQLLSEIGGIANSLLMIVLALNSYVEKKLKELDIFNQCCTDCKQETDKAKEKEKEKENVSLKMNEVKARKSIFHSSEKKFLDMSKSVGDVTHLDLEKNNDNQDQNPSNRKLTENKNKKKGNEPIEDKDKKKEKMVEEESNNNVVRYKSVIFSKDVSLDKLVTVDYSFLEIIFPCKRNDNHKEKMLIAEKFCDEFFDIHFLFGNVLDSQIIFKKFENMSMIK